MIEQPEGTGARHIDLGEGREVEQYRAVAHHGGLAFGDGLPGLRAAHRIGEVAFRLTCCVPQPALPADGEAEDGALCGPVLVQGRAAQVAPGARLLEGPVHGEEVGDRLAHALLHVRRRCGPWIGAGDVDAPQVTRLLGRDDPVGQHVADAGGAHDADRVHAGGDIEPVHLRRLADIGPRVGGEALGAIHETLDAGLGQLRNEIEGGLHEGAELVPVLRHFEEGAVALGAIGIPDLGVGFEAADDEAAGIALHIDAAVEVAHHGEGVGQAGHGLGDDVHVLHRLQRQGDARFVGEFLRPGAGAEHDLVRRKPAAVGEFDAGGAALLGEDAANAGVLADGDAVGLRRPGIGHAEVDRVDVGILRHHQRADMVLQRELRDGDILRGDDRRREAHVAADAADALQLIHALRHAGEPVAAGAAVAGAHARLFLEPGEEREGVGGQARHGGGGAEGPDDASGVPRGAGGELVALEQDNVLRAAQAEVIGDAEAHRTAADDDDAGHQK